MVDDKMEELFVGGHDVYRPPYTRLRNLNYGLERRYGCFQLAELSNFFIGFWVRF